MTDLVAVEGRVWMCVFGGVGGEAMMAEVFCVEGRTCVLEISYLFILFGIIFNKH